MAHLKEYFEAINGQITGGESYGWTTFGEHARYLDSDREGHYSISAVFDSQTQQVYTLELWDYDRELYYRWIDPDYVEAQRSMSESKGVKFNMAFDQTKFIDLELAEDMFEKISARVQDQDYDQRVKVPLNLEEDQVNALMRMAHEQDITLNQLVERILRAQMGMK